MWRARDLRAEEIKLLRAARERFDLNPLAVHANYLINLASNEPEIRAKSIAAFRGELQRAVAIGAEYLVLHPGSYRGQSVEEGIAAFVLGLRDACRGVATGSLMVLIENTAGAGAQLGSRFEELQSIRDLARDLTDLSLGYCLDTCHLFAAGFNIAAAEGLRSTLRSAGELLGFNNIRLVHANDSQAPLGKRIDRHANIGEGHIGREGFHRLLRHPRLRRVPFILETPAKEGNDRRNLDTLKALAVMRLTTERQLMSEG